MSYDVAILETGNGGDTLKTGRDLTVVFGFENMVYLALFGGNPGFITKGKKIESEQAFDYWGNFLFEPNEEGRQFNSLTEQRLMEVALNSSGRASIEEAVKKDLKFMKEFANVEVAVSILSDDKLRIDIKVIRPDNLQEKRFIYIWDAVNLGLANIETPKGGLQEGLQFGLIG